MKNATLCFLVMEEDNKIQRICLARKKRGLGKDYWNGYGGKAEEGESIQEAAIRELWEESTVKAQIDDLDEVGVINFSLEGVGDWVVNIFLLRRWSGEPTETKEMEPEWFNIEEIPYNKMWEDDSHWLPLVLDYKKIKASFDLDKNNKLLSQKIEIVQ